MQDQLITFETALLAKEKGLNELCSSCYDSKGIVHHNYLENGSSSDTEFRVDLEDLFENFNNYGKTVYSAPTQTTLQRWLREVHGIHIGILPKILPSNEIKYYCFKGKIKKDFKDLHNTYEEALEAGLQEALKLIK